MNDRMLFINPVVAVVVPRMLLGAFPTVVLYDVGFVPIHDIAPAPVNNRPIPVCVSANRLVVG